MLKQNTNCVYLLNKSLKFVWKKQFVWHGKIYTITFEEKRWNEEPQSQVQINPQDYNVQINPQESNVAWNIFIVLNTYHLIGQYGLSSKCLTTL